MKENDSFRTFLNISIAIHISIIAGSFIKHWLMPGQMLVVPEAIRVDVVALPDKLPPPAPPVQQAPKMPPLPVAKITPPKPTPPVKPKNFKSTQNQALAELKAMEEIEKMQQQLNASTAKPAPEKTPKYKGNIISSGDSFSGLSRLHVNDYLAALKAKVQAHWTLPQWLSDANLKAQVIVTLDADGSISRSQIYASSGNAIFDNSCLAAIQNASPFSPPPDEVKNSVLLIHFPF